MNTKLKWYGYVHENHTVHVKRFFGDYGDINETVSSPFTIFVTGPFNASVRDEAIQTVKDRFTAHLAKSSS